ncbi:MAG: hypothetical protein M3Y33_17480 [Actinomycetota bacterium]|nr:hypothetical protein [Actinomycetota bacterium]
MPELRPAGADDFEAIVGVFLDCWTISYSNSMPAGLVDAMTRERRIRTRRRHERRRWPAWTPPARRPWSCT